MGHNHGYFSRQSSVEKNKLFYFLFFFSEYSEQVNKLGYTIEFTICHPNSIPLLTLIYIKMVT